MKITRLRLDGLLVFAPVAHGDRRGFLCELWNQRRYQEAGVVWPFVQDNLSRSVRGILRGLHAQNPHPQGKLVTVLEGEIFDVALDLRPASPTFGQWEAVTLSADHQQQVYLPPGFAHGFQVLSPSALVHYKCTDYYSPADELGVRWDDPDLGIPWPLPQPVLSAKDAALPRLKDVPAARLRI